jgi:uncharacterized membrane protein YhaH (DUF805 family)
VLTRWTLNVAEACSGMRMVIAFIALAVAVAFLLLQLLVAAHRGHDAGRCRLRCS